MDKLNRQPDKTKVLHYAEKIERLEPYLDMKLGEEAKQRIKWIIIALERNSWFEARNEYNRSTDVFLLAHPGLNPEIGAILGVKNKKK